MTTLKEVRPEEGDTQFLLWRNADLHGALHTLWLDTTAHVLLGLCFWELQLGSLVTIACNMGQGLVQNG